MAKAKYSYNEKRKEWYTLVYDGTLTSTGAKHRKRITSKKSSADLEKKVIAFKQSLQETGAFPSNITFGEYAHEWLSIAKSTKEINTRYMYASIVRSCFDEINDVPLHKLTQSSFQRCINQKIDHPRTCQQIKLTFQQIIRAAVRDRLLPHSALNDLLMDVSLPKYQKPLKRPLSALEKDALIKADLDERKRAFVSILYYCGLRKGEVLALTPEDFNFEEKTLTVSKAWVQGTIKPYPKSDNGVRTVPLPDAAIDKIKPFVVKCSSYIFHGQNKPIMTEDAYRRMWQSIICSMNIALGYNPQAKKNRAERQITNLTAHTFRHNYCTELCYQIPLVSTKEIARLLGDNEKMVIEVYSHLVEGKENTFTAINNVFQG